MRTFSKIEIRDYLGHLYYVKHEKGKWHVINTETNQDFYTNVDDDAVWANIGKRMVIRSCFPTVIIDDEIIRSE